MTTGPGGHICKQASKAPSGAARRPDRSASNVLPLSQRRNSEPGRFLRRSVKKCWLSLSTTNIILQFSLTKRKRGCLRYIPVAVVVEGEGAVPPQAERGNALTRGALTSWE